MELAAILLAIIVVLLLYMGNRFLKDARAIRRELSQGATLKELDDMVTEAREQLLSDYDEVTGGLDTRIQKLGKLNREAETMTGRLEGVLNSERLKSLEDRGILFAIEATGGPGGKEKDRNKRIADLLKGGASVEEVARITEASVREVELVRMLIKRKDQAEGA